MVKNREANKTFYGKLCRIPGMTQAFMIVDDYSGWFRHVNKVEQDSDEKLKEIERMAIRKIAELWGLSEAAAEVLINRRVEIKPKIKEIELGKKRRGGIGLLDYVERVDKSYELGAKILLGEKKDVNKVQKACLKLKEISVKILPLEISKEKHIYLDVTEIDYKTYAKAYKAVLICRAQLGIEKKRDLRRGAPESVDGTRAFTAALIEERGFKRKEIAETMDFKIYREDNPSGSYPLLQKYLKVGRQINEMLEKLEAYMQNITKLKSKKGWFEANNLK